MKQLSLLMVVFYFLCSSAIAQAKIEFGVNTEGSLLLFGDIPHYSQPKKNTLGAGIGVYASRNIAGRLSADLGVMYRFKQMKEYYDIGSTGYGGYDGSSPYSPETVQGWKFFPLHYVVVPLTLTNLLSPIFSPSDSRISNNFL